MLNSPPFFHKITALQLRQHSQPLSPEDLLLSVSLSVALSLSLSLSLSLCLCLSPSQLPGRQAQGESHAEKGELKGDFWGPLSSAPRRSVERSV